jgi:2-haloacid dehalogenase
MPIKAIAFDAYGTLFDPASVSRAVEAAFPGHGDFIGAVWRQKQLEYTWQRSAMGRFADFGTVTREALVYAIRTVHAEVDERIVEEVCRGFDHLALYPEAKDALRRLGSHRLAVLSNGSDAMLAALLGGADIAAFFPTIVSSDRVRAFKPHPAFYHALVETLALPADEIALVSSNGFDLAGARHFGLATIRVERVPPARMREMTRDGAAIAPAAAFVALRSQMDEFAGSPDHVCRDLGGVVEIAKGGEPGS